MLLMILIIKNCIRKTCTTGNTSEEITAWRCWQCFSYSHQPSEFQNTITRTDWRTDALTDGRTGDLTEDTSKMNRRSNRDKKWWTFGLKADKSLSFFLPCCPSHNGSEELRIGTYKYWATRLRCSLVYWFHNPHCLHPLRAPLRSFLHSLAHSFTHFRARGKVNDYMS